MKKSISKYMEKIESSILRQEISHRGGGVEISLDAFGFKGEKMAAYQNYLGGGMLGRICVNDTIRTSTPFVELKMSNKLDEIGEALMRYFHNLTNHDDDEFESETFEQNQNRKPVSAY